MADQIGQFNFFEPDIQRNRDGADLGDPKEEVEVLKCVRQQEDNPVSRADSTALKQRGHSVGHAIQLKIGERAAAFGMYQANFRGLKVCLMSQDIRNVFHPVKVRNTRPRRPALGLQARIIFVK